MIQFKNNGRSEYIAKIGESDKGILIEKRQGLWFCFLGCYDGSFKARRLGRGIEFNTLKEAKQYASENYSKWVDLYK